MAGLLREPGRYDVFQAIRLLELGVVSGVRGRPLGHDFEPRAEVARLRGAASLGFPVNALESVKRTRAGADGAVEVTVAFAGVLGACGALPWPYTEYAVDRLAQRDRSLRDFVDMLQHRSLSFLFRAWRKYRLPFAFEAAAQRGQADDVSTALCSLVGLGTGHLRERVVEGADRWVYFAGLFARGQRTAAGLESMLHALTGYPAVVREFVGRWQALPPGACSRLGGPPGAWANEIGGSLILGDRVWDVLSGVRIRIGPVDAQVLPELVTAGGRFPWLASLIRSYLGPDVDFDVLCSVDPATVRPAALGTGEGTRLGGSAWLTATDPAGYDSEVLVCSSP